MTGFSATQDLYRGLDWVELSGGIQRALSDTTGMVYKIQRNVENPAIFDLSKGFPERAGRPHAPLGLHTALNAAKTAAEWDDFQYWQSVSLRHGRKPVFVGSPDGVEGFAQNIPAHERSETLSLMLPPQDDGPTAFARCASFFHATHRGLKQEKTGEYTLTLTLDAENIPLWLFSCKPGLGLHFGVKPEGTGDDERERQKHALKRFFGMVQDTTFQEWLLHRYDKWSLIKTAALHHQDAVEEATEETLKRLLGVPQRRELLTNLDAVEKLERLDREHYTDLSMGWKPAPAPLAQKETDTRNPAFEDGKNRTISHEQDPATRTAP